MFTWWKGCAQDIGGAQTPGSTQFQANTVPSRNIVATWDFVVEND